MHHRLGSVCSQPYLFWRLGVGPDPAAQYFERKDTIVSGAGDARDVKRHPHHRSVATLCRQPTDTDERRAGRWRCQTLSYEHAVGTPVRLRRHLISRPQAYLVRRPVVAPNSGQGAAQALPAPRRRADRSDDRVIRRMQAVNAGKSRPGSFGKSLSFSHLRWLAEADRRKAKYARIIAERN